MVDNVVEGVDGSPKPEFKSNRSSPQLTPTRLFTNQVKSILRDKKKEHSHKLDPLQEVDPMIKQSCSDGSELPSVRNQRRSDHDGSQEKCDTLKRSDDSDVQDHSPLLRKQKRSKQCDSVERNDTDCDVTGVSPSVWKHRKTKQHGALERSRSIKICDDSNTIIKVGKTEKLIFSRLPVSLENQHSRVCKDDNAVHHHILTEAPLTETQSDDSVDFSNTCQNIPFVNEDRKYDNSPYFLQSQELRSSTSSLQSSTSDLSHSSQPTGDAGSSWPFPMSPSYFVTTPPPPVRQRTSSDHSDRLSTLTSTPAMNQEKKYQRLQNLHQPPKPNYHGFQLLGDSMLLRFSQQILDENPIVTESLRFLGYCVSGQRIGELLKRLKSGFYHLGKRVVLMIGTNDLLRNTSVEQMCSELHGIVKILKEFSEQVVILTLPPVPRLENSTDHWRRLEKYNNYIKNLGSADWKISISDLFPMYVCTEEEVEERDITIQYYSNSLFCYGCLLCVDNSDDSDSSESEDCDSTSCMHSITYPNSCVSVNDVSPLFTDRRIPKCRTDCFEVFFTDMRKDLIHLNKKGLQVVDEHLRKHLPLP